MKRILVGSLLFSVTAIFIATSALACGDKFLVPGRGPQFNQAFAAPRPGHILIYRNPASPVVQAVMDRDVQKSLERVGHQVDVVESSADLEKALNSGKYDLLLADVSDLESILQGERAEPKPTPVPVVYRASWTAVTDLKKDYEVVLNGPSRVSQTLALIQEAMTLHESAI